MSLSNFARPALISLKNISILKISLPDISTQRKIATILSAYDDFIENNLRRIKILEEMAQNLYREWFVNFRFPGHEKVRMVDSPLGKIPEGWEVTGIMECPYIEIIRENIRPYPGMKIYYATADVDGIQISGKGIEFAYDDKPSRAQKQPEVNSVWFARMQETYKVIAFTNSNEPICRSCMLSSGFVGFRSSAGFAFPFLYYTINSEDFHRRKDQFCTGATQRSLTNEGLSRIQIVVPLHALVAKFGNIIEANIDHILILFQKNRVLQTTRDLLLPKLISGEVDVSELDITIPEVNA